MKKHKILLIVLGVVAFLVIIATLGRFTNKTNEPGMIFFYGDTCPHCKNVEAYFTESGIENKVKFQKLEVYNNKDNAQLLAQTAKKCGLDTSQGVGVPVFYDGQSCIQGDQPIIDYLKAK
jgi:glutaredoxin